jgi:hypothetical protein
MTPPVVLLLLFVEERGRRGTEGAAEPIRVDDW